MADFVTMLNLTSEELNALARQGFVTSEVRGHGAVVYKLRFRVDGRQVVRYLGTDPHRAAEIRESLALLQNRRRLERRIATHIKQTNALLRSIKPRLAQQVEEAGFHFHGRVLRRSRAAVHSRTCHN